MSEEIEYNADSLVKLEYPISVWKRPSMYLGERGGQQSVGVREILDNSTHECVRGFATKMRVTFGADSSITVQDDGRGLPVDVNSKTGINGIILTMATLHAGGNFSSNVAVGRAGAGLNGVGASATNALSKRFDVTVFKGGKRYQLSFQNGFPGHFENEDPDSAFTPSDEIFVEKDSRTPKEKAEFKTGTLIRFWYNPDRFPKDEAVDVDDLVARLRYTAYIVPHFKISVVDESRTYEDGSFYSWDFHSEHGLSEMVEVMAPAEALPGTESKENFFTQKGIHHFTTAARYHELGADEHGTVRDVERTATAEVSFMYNTGYEKTLASFVNTIHTHMGGVHERAFEKALLKAFGDRMSSMRGVLTAKDDPPILDDFFEGMTVALSVNIPEPQFVGQQKDKISGPEVEKALTRAFTDVLTTFASDSANQAFLKPMFEKVAQASRNRRAAAEAKLAKRKSNQVSSSAMPTKLADCDVTGEEESELIICEGDSAAGTVIKARDAIYQAVLPIRGKILNALKADNSKILANKEIMDIATALGAGFGQNFDVEKIRYGKVLFASDADADGLQINNLLLTLFYRLFKDMVLEGRVYQTMPPLFEIHYGSGRTEKIIYALNEAALSRELKILEAKKVKYKMMRNKGLGAMTPEGFSETVLNPETRALRRITLEDVERAEQALELTMGDNSQERRDFMTDNFQTAIDSGLVEGYESGLE